MDFLFELIFEVIIEGTIELGTSKKVPSPIRVLLLLILGVIFGALIGMFAMIGIDCWKRGDIAIATLLFAIAVALTLFVVFGLGKKYKENKKDSQ